jgi:5-methylcytosine-specific restriction endonuclease McrA
MKACVNCHVDYPATAEHFYVLRRRGRVEFVPRCKVCIRADRVADRARRPEAHKETMRKSRQRHGARWDKNKQAAIMADPERLAAKKATDAAWQAENKDHVIAYRRARYLTHADEIKAAAIAYHAANPEKARVWRRGRRARLRNAKGVFTEADVKAILRSQSYRCYWCRDDISEEHHNDHFVPLARGGSNWPENIVGACPTCNISRRDKLPGEFLAYLAKIADLGEEIARRRAYMSAYMRRRRASA